VTPYQRGVVAAEQEGLWCHDSRVPDTSQKHALRRTFLDWVKMEFLVAKPSQKLQAVTAPDEDAGRRA
jgi:hypothetical protein